MQPHKKYKEFLCLGFMYVKPAFRGKGINQKILQRLIDCAKNCRYHGIGSAGIIHIREKLIQPTRH
jgi:GNAT superfamily N-acetyltransferase